MKDWIDLIDLRDKHGIEIVCITEPFDETPAGKLNSNMLAAISQFYSDQLSIRTAEGVERRVRTGLFSGRAPYGYKNYRENGRGLIRINLEQADNVRRIFDLYAFRQHSLDSLVATLRDEGRIYSEKHPDFVRSKLYTILTDRSYIGEIQNRGQWWRVNTNRLSTSPLSTACRFCSATRATTATVPSSVMALSLAVTMVTLSCAK